MRENGSAPYIGPNGLADYDLVLSYTGGRALQDLRTLLGARAVHTLYGSADPEVHHPVPYAENYRADMSYLGTFASDRQQILEQLFVESARQLPNYRFLIGGSQYPDQFPWTENIYYAGHVTPDQHPQFYCSARLNLSVTRGVMANMGFCPSGRLFEAAACGAPVLTDYWEGLETFFEPEREILIASTTEEAIDALQRPPDELRAIGSNARERVLASHTAEHRAIEFENALAQVSNSSMQPALGGI
jgi:spore maturation protein CgeB